MTDLRTGFDPDYRVHPGETVKEIIEDFNLSQRVAAKSLGVSEAYLSDIINGKRGISPVVAERLEGVFGPSAKFWMRMQATYDAPLPSERDPASPSPFSPGNRLP